MYKISPIMEYFLIVVGLFFIVMGTIAIILVAKQNKRKKAFAEQMTPEQKERLAAADCERSHAEEGGFTTEGLITEILEKKDKLFLSVMFHNKAIQNRWINQLMLLDIPSTREEVQAHQLKVGDYVKFFTNAFDTDLNAGKGGGIVGGMEAAKKKKSYLIF